MEMTVPAGPRGIQDGDQDAGPEERAITAGHPRGQVTSVNTQDPRCSRYNWCGITWPCVVGREWQACCGTL